MRRIHHRAAALALLAFCTLGGAATAALRPPSPRALEATPVLHHLYNLDYSTGKIYAFRIAGDHATLEDTFEVVKPKDGAPGGLAARPGLIYTAVTSTTSEPCASCFEVFRPNGKRVDLVPAPVLPGAPAAPDITDLSVDRFGDVFLSDYGQQAAYFYQPIAKGYAGPTIVEEGSGAASIAVSPNSRLVFIQGNCGFGQARQYVLTNSGYQPGACFGLGTVALIGAAADDQADVFTPVDGVPGLVSISDAQGKGVTFNVPDGLGEIGSIALSQNGVVAYIADHRGERVYAFTRPAGGWLSGKMPHLIATYTGFKALDIIAVP